VKSPRYWSTPCSYKVSKGIASTTGGGAGGALSGADPEPPEPEHADSVTVNTRVQILALIGHAIVDVPFLL
jgi:hypothetical protein